MIEDDSVSPRDANERIKKVTTYLCGTCNEELKNIDGSMDIFGSFMKTVNQRYCENKDCKRYGVVTVAAIPHEVIS